MEMKGDVERDNLLVYTTVQFFMSTGAFMTETSGNPEFLRGWNAALTSARACHEAKASQAMVQSRRTRFPKNFEREAEFHGHSAELIVTLSPEDV